METVSTIGDVGVISDTSAHRGSRTSPHVLKPKLLVVSSYRRPCGIAQYLEFLETPLRAQSDYDVEIAALPVDLFRSKGNYARRAANRIFTEILARARDADIVSIQLELGLLGVSPFQIWRRLRALVRASRRVVITYHTAPVVGRTSFRFRRSDLADALRVARINYVFKHLFSYVRHHPRKFRHLVQTRREAFNFGLLGVDQETIIVEPLSFLGKEKRNELTASSTSRVDLCRRYEIRAGHIVGCFGFLADYKGIEVATRALQRLPDDYHLMIVGGLHPEGIVHHTTKQPYLAKLMAEIEKMGIGVGRRIHFCGALGNEDFNLLMSGCDAIVLPYAEVGQTSSGPAALALDMQKPLYCSRTHCFRELDKFGPDAVTFFEIGNHIELAQKLQLREAELPHRVEARRRYAQSHNVELRAQIYLDAARQLLQEA